MDGGREIDTWPILEDLLARGVSVSVPRVNGKEPRDMAMYRLTGGIEQARAFPRTKWGIPEPSKEMATTMEDATEAEDLSLLLVPAVAFDSRCGRLGHGRGYYDAFISRQRQLHQRASPSAPPLQVIGVGLREQLVDFELPMVAGQDERMDLVITPDGPLAYTSASDMAKAAGLMAAAGGVAAAAGTAAAVDVTDETEETDKKKRARAQDEAKDGGLKGGASSGAAALSVRCEVAEGRYKYACLRIEGLDGEAFISIRSGPGSYHADVAAPMIDNFRMLGYRAKPLGGGRILRTDSPKKTVHIYGYSVGFGGAEGGPPGRGMKDHSEAAALVREALPDYEVTFSSEGY